MAPPQHSAIYARGGTLLVSAAAGSGKTAVLVERVVQLICDDHNPVDVDRLLVVTFSNAAASEMKQRVGNSLSKKISEAPDNIFFQKQKALLGSANISTVHSFCLDLIRQNFQSLSISPDFSVIDEAELDILKKNCVEECIEEFYADSGRSQLFGELVELLTSGRDDTRVKETVFKIYDFARSHPFYKKWLDGKLAMYDPSLPPKDTVWGKTILRYAKESLEYAVSSMNGAIELILADEKLTKGYFPMYQSDLQQLLALQGACVAEDWDDAVEQALRFHFDRLGSVRGECPDKEQVQQIRNDAKGIIDDLKGRYLSGTTEDFKGDMRDLQPKISLLFDLVKTFGDKLDEEKAIRKKLDFSDLEHLTLQLLADEDKNPTPQALEISQQYEHVLVDEYQDTNEVQDLIFSSISRQEKNLFMVGDVKQSIYSFRMAMPEIFIEKRNRFTPYPKKLSSDSEAVSFDKEAVFPASIFLDTNFRSRKEITDSINFIFEQIMSSDMGEIDYNEEECLKPGAKYVAYEQASPELLLINAEDYSGEQSYVQLEATEIAKKISQMIDEGYQVQVKGGKPEDTRSVKASDFCILLRSHKNKAAVYIDKLIQQGVPAWAENSGGFLQAREVSAVVSLLRVLDNPLLDIELTAALLSPLFDFTNDDLVRVRLQNKSQPLYVGLQSLASEGDEKAGHALELFSQLRRYSASHSAEDLLLELYNKTSILEIVKVMSMGQSRHANLLLLMEYAAHYNQVGYKGLGGFVALLEQLQDRGGDLAPANILGDSANVVRVMSIHRSKGLEFPVVVLADTAKEFNMMDLREITLLHSEYGFACVRRDRETLAQYQTVPMGAIRIELQKTMLSEEMRVLYVALTRAREKLIVVSTIRRRFEQTLANLVEDISVTNKISPFRVSEAKSYSDWIIMALLHHPSASALREAAGGAQTELISDETDWIISVIKPDGKPREKEAEKAQTIPLPDAQLLRLIEERANFVYPHEIETRLPTKMAVSDVVSGEKNLSYRFARRPRFLTEGGLTPAEKGTAMHNFMQFSNYENAKSNLSDEIKRMEKDGFLSPIQVENLSPEKLEEFFSSSLAERIFSSEQVYRELRFMAELGKEELSHVLEEMEDTSKIVLQGVADCVFIEHGKAIIVDYKTDKVSSLEELSGRYDRQLALYRRILGESLEKEVSQTILYSFHLSAWIDTSPSV